nr:MAG TPA: hypothetical protein [Caudoviricetes sp.]
MLLIVASIVLLICVFIFPLTTLKGKNKLKITTF